MDQLASDKFSSINFKYTDRRTSQNECIQLTYVITIKKLNE